MSDIFKTKQNNTWVGIPSLIGPQGPTGPQGIQGPQGTAAGFSDTTNVTVTELAPGATPTVQAQTSGPATSTVLNFSFGLPGTPKFSEVTIPSSSWSYVSASQRYTATVTLTGMTASANALVGGLSSSMEAIISNSVYCSGQGTNSLIFTAFSKPSSSLKFGVYWL